MISLNTFIQQCEKDLVLNRNLSKETLNLTHDLSEKNKFLCRPIIEFIGKDLLYIENEVKNIDFSSNERILVCRLIPLMFAMDTSNPTWSSYMLTQAIKATTSIIDIKLSEIGIAFMNILCENNTPLNKEVYNFCIDISREFSINYRTRLREFDFLINFKESCIISSSVFLKYALVPVNSYQPEFILKSMIGLIKSEYFENFLKENKYLFEDRKYKETFLEYLSNSEISNDSRDLILSKVKSV